MNFFSWLFSFFSKAPAVAPEIKPLIVEGETVIADLTKLVADLKANSVVDIINDSNVMLSDVQKFVLHVQQVATLLQLKRKV